MIIRRIEDKDIEALIDFNIRTYEDRDRIDESFRYRYLNTPYKESFRDESLIALNNDNKIIGQALLLPARLSYKGKEYQIYWGMDYFVEESYRGLSGVMLVKKTIEHENHFGVGLTKVSLGVHLAAGEKIAGYLRKFMKFRFSAVVLPFLYLNFKGDIRSRKFPEKILMKKGRFERVYSPDEIVSKKGYWNHDLIEFNRSREFMEWRFFHYEDKYKVYKYIPPQDENQDQPVYFVVRPVVWRNVKCLLLVDHRYPDERRDFFDLILKAAKKLTRKTGRAATITGCSLPSYYPILKKNWFLEFGTKMVVVSKFPLLGEVIEKQEDIMLITFADSDCDFYYGNSKW